MIPFRRARPSLAAIAAIGAMLAAAAEARDLPRGRGAPPVRTGCESFGPDFHKLEGSDTCLRISGSAEVQAVVRTGSGAGASFVPSPGKR